LKSKKGNPYSITERRVPELIPVLGRQPAGDVSHNPHAISPQRLMLETSNFVHGSAMRSLILVMSECFLSERGQGHVSNLPISTLWS